MKTTTNRFSGAGGAHLGFRMFGARGPLLGEADGGGASGAGGEAGAGAAGAAGGDAGAANGEGGKPAADEPKFTQKQLDEIVKDRVAQAKRNAQKPAAPSGDDAAEKLTMKQLAERLDESEARRAFDRKASKLGISDEASDDLFTLYKAQKPENADEWFESKSKRFGLSNATQNQNPNQQAAPEEKAKIRAAAAAPNAPATNVADFTSQNGAVDVYRMTPEQFAATPPEKIKELHERNVALQLGRSGAPPLPKTSLLPSKR